MDKKQVIQEVSQEIRNYNEYRDENGHESYIPDMRLYRKGECNPNKCKSACCKFYLISGEGSTSDYTSGFFETKNKYNDFIMSKNCKHLDVKNNKCKVWGTDEFPEVCRQFPNPSDQVYKHVFDVCTFKFELEPVK